MLGKGIGLLVGVFVLSISFVPAFALTELERSTINDPRLVNAFGVSIGSLVNVDQQIQISADVTNHQEKTQTFVYLVQIKNEEDHVISLGWISGQLTPDQMLSPSLSWTPKKAGSYTAEIYLWESVIQHKALSEHNTLQINVS